MEKAITVHFYTTLLCQMIKCSIMQHGLQSVIIQEWRVQIHTIESTVFAYQQLRKYSHYVTSTCRDPLRNSGVPLFGLTGHKQWLCVMFPQHPSHTVTVTLWQFGWKGSFVTGLWCWDGAQCVGLKLSCPYSWDFVSVGERCTLSAWLSKGKGTLALSPHAKHKLN